MTGAELSALKAVARRHLEVHNRLPEQMALRLIQAIEELERALAGRADA